MIIYSLGIYIFAGCIKIASLFNKKARLLVRGHKQIFSILEEQTDRYFMKSERPVPERFSIVFSSKSDTLPKLRSLNFDWNNSIIIEENPTKDTIQYWIADTLISHQDTLSIEMTYYATDTLGNLALTTDTLSLTPRKTLEKILKENVSEPPAEGAEDAPQA